MKRWTYNYEKASVLSVECERRGYPHHDEHGQQQYDNTHFDTEEEAWERLLLEAKAGASLRESRRVEARAELESATQALADAAEVLVRATRGFEAWQKEQG